MPPSTPTANSNAAPRWTNVALALFVNAVPLVGVLRYGWSAINVLALYWFETLLIVVCTAVRLAVQRRRMRARRDAAPTTFDRDGQSYRVNQFGFYFNSAIGVFVVVEGIFVVIFAVMLAHHAPNNPMWLFSPPQMARGASMLVAMFGIDLLAGLRNIGANAGAWDSAEADNRLRRLGVLHMSLWFGMLAMKFAGWPYGVLVALVVLKTFADISSALGWRGWSGRRAGSP